MIFHNKRDAQLKSEHTEREIEKIKRIIFSVLPFLFAIFFALIFSNGTDRFGFLPGICQEILAGTTEGRQALWGSCWHSPLMTLFYLPLAWLFPITIAEKIAAFLSWFALFHTGQTISRPVSRFNHLFGYVTQLLFLFFAIWIGCRGLLFFALPFALLIYSGAALFRWSISRTIEDVVRTGISNALLMFCGAPFFLASFFIILSLLLVGLGGKASAKRFQAWLLLGELPVLYGIGIWFLLNKLVFTDPCYFLRSLPFVTKNLPVTQFLLSLLGVWTIVWICSLIFRQKLFTGLFLFLCVIGTFCAQLFLFQSEGIFLNSFSMQSKNQMTDLLGNVEKDIKKRTPDGRVLVIGYPGLYQLAIEKHSSLFQSNMDLHISTLRKAFQEQTLFVLCPEPIGLNKTESIFWRYPDFYSQGAERMLYTESYGSWNLYQMITAPTREQIDSWKNK